MTGVDPKGLSQAAFEDKIEAIAHRWAIASYNKALGRTFEDIDAIKVELRRALTPLKGAPEVEAAQRIFEVMCGGPVDWAKHAADTNEDNLFQSADWDRCLTYARAVLCTEAPDIGRPVPRTFYDFDDEEPA